MNDKVIAYTAGFFDGEGTVCILKSQDKKRRMPSFSVAVKIGQKRRGPLEFIQSYFGGKIYLTKRRGLSALFVLDFLGKDTKVKLLEAILPLTIVKKAEIEMALEYLKRDSERLPNSAHITEMERDWREDIFQRQSRLRRLNSTMIDELGQCEFPVTVPLFKNS